MVAGASSSRKQTARELEAPATLRPLPAQKRPFNPRMPKIQVLSEVIANQIAAGEVVERPAAAIKECIENSLDAGAVHVRVRVEEGGRRLMEISDDGCGMDAADLPLAVQRHATSKLQAIEDLDSIRTLGFRGEALASIAAVSEFSLASRRGEDSTGSCLSVTGGVLGRIVPQAMNAGTVVTIRNLFCNVPARLKFLKSVRSESAAIQEAVLRLALGHPEVAFRLESECETVFDFPARQDLSARIRTRFGAEVAQGLIPLVGSSEGLSLEGFIVHPSQAKPSSRGQYIFLNGRAIEDRTVVAALREGFQGFLEPRLHPMAFLHLDVDPRQVDVNVHPAKTEVRFRSGDTVFRLVQQTVKTALSRAVTIAPADMPMDAVVRREIVKAAGPVSPAPIQERFLPHQVEVQNQVQNRVEDRSVAYSAAPLPPVSRPVAPAAVQVVLPSVEAHRQETEKIQTGGPQAISQISTELPANIKRIVQLRKSWILVECDEGILILDQHALHEKALYTSLEGNTRTLDGGGIQNLLIPISVTLDTQRLETLRGVLPALSQRGIEADISGSSIQIRRHPQILARLDWQVFFEELATQLEQGHYNADPLAQALRALSHRSACKAAVKAGQELSQPELRELVRLYFSSPDLTHCPHGRPVAMRLSWTELERRFQR